MEKIMLNLESDTFNGLKADFDELLQKLLEKLQDGKIAEGSITMKLNVSLEEVFSAELGKNIVVPLFKHKTVGSYTEKLENGGAVSLPNMYLEYDEELEEFVMRPAGGQQDLFTEQENGDNTIDVTVVRQNASAPAQLRDPLCNDCFNRDTEACDQCSSGSMWEPKVE